MWICLPNFCDIFYVFKENPLKDWSVFTGAGGVFQEVTVTANDFVIFVKSEIILNICGIIIVHKISYNRNLASNKLYFTNKVEVQVYNETVTTRLTISHARD